MRFGNLRSSGGGFRGLKLAVYTGMTLSIIAIVVVASVSVELTTIIQQRRSSELAALSPVSIIGQIVTPPSSYMDAPPILKEEPFGQRLTDINLPLNSTELGMINDEPDSYFDTAAHMWLNGSLTTLVGTTLVFTPLLSVNGKPAVFYLGAISCQFCGENRWAMALALSRFGTFQDLFFGYSALGDADIPTLYWAPAEYNSTSAVEFGNFYNGTYVTFLSVEYSSLITAGFQMQGLPYFQHEANVTGNIVYAKALNQVVSLNDFNGTPYTIWSNYVVPAADAEDFGDSTSTTSTSSGNSSTTSSSILPIASMTHDQILESLAHPNSQFAWTEYAAADYYVALVCYSIGAVSVSSSAVPPVCSEPYVSSMSTIVHEGGVNNPAP